MRDSAENIQAGLKGRRFFEEEVPYPLSHANVTRTLCRQNMIYRVCEILPDIHLCVLTVQYISPIIIFRINRALCNNGVGLKTLTVIYAYRDNFNFNSLGSLYNTFEESAVILALLFLSAYHFAVCAIYTPHLREHTTLSLQLQLSQDSCQLSIIVVVKSSKDT